MRTRERSGRYTGHNTPGDGTGMTKLPESDYDEILTDAKGGDPATIKYDPAWDHKEK
jgi:hypothetical protein